MVFAHTFTELALVLACLDILVSPSFFVQGYACPPSFLAVGESCYYLNHTGAAFDLHRLACNRSGGSLVKIDTQSKESLLNSHIAGKVMYISYCKSTPQCVIHFICYSPTLQLAGILPAGKMFYDF